MVVTRCAVACFVLCLPLLSAGCGQSDQEASGAQSAEVTAGSAAPAVAPEGSTSYTVGYRCRSGREAAITVDVSQLRDLAATLNRIQPCEYDRGFDHGTVIIECPSGARVVPIRGNDGRAVPPSENELPPEC